MRTSDELARQARATREQLNRTADELRARLNGPSLVDEMTGFLAQSGGSVLPDRPVAKANYVLPLALIGAGIAWLALEARRREQRAARGRELAAAMADAALDDLRQAAERMDAVEPVRSTAGDRVQPLPTAVESVSIAPSVPNGANQDQRTLPL